MSYNPKIYASVKDALEQNRRKAIADADRRTAEVGKLYPEIAQVDAILSQTGLRIMEAIRMGNYGLSERMTALEEENALLLEKRREYLLSHGLPADYTDPKFSCKTCEDSGYYNNKMCSCLRQALFLAGVAQSGLGKLPETQNFDNFRTEYYTDPESVSTVLEYCRRFANNFSEKTRENILITGATGLGKTHLSTAIAREAILRGYDVRYDSLPNILSDFEFDRYKSSYKDSELRGERYLTCDLLIMDDLGTEVVNQFTLSCLYNIINTRLAAEKPTIISTNLGEDALQERYNDRITSRLLGEYRPLIFVGQDIRMQKLK